MTPVGVSAALLNIAEIRLGKIPPPISDPPSCISIYEDDDGISKCIVRVFHSNIRCDVFRTIEPPCEMSSLPEYFTSFHSEDPTCWRIRDPGGLIDNMLDDKTWREKNSEELLTSVCKIVTGMVKRREKEAKQTKIVPVDIEPEPEIESPKIENIEVVEEKEEKKEEDIPNIPPAPTTPISSNASTTADLPMRQTWKEIVEEALKTTFDSDGVALSQIHLNNMIENQPYTLFYAKDKVLCLKGCMCPSLIQHLTKYTQTSLPMINGKNVRISGNHQKPRLAREKVNLDSYLQAASVSIYKGETSTTNEPTKHAHLRNRHNRGSVLRFTRQMEIQRLKR